MLEETLKNLRSNKIKAQYFESKLDLTEYLNHTISDFAKVGVGDSVTLEELDVYNYLKSRNVEYLDKYNPNLTKEEKRELYLNNFSADYFLTSANAVAKTGKIYNLDGNGSRVTPIIYGPKKVLIICGLNKIVVDDEAALKRIKEIAAPQDAKRLNKNTPCTKLGKCVDCKSKDKICNYHTVVQGQFDENRIEVLLVKGNYGF